MSPARIALLVLAAAALMACSREQPSALPASSGGGSTPAVASAPSPAAVVDDSVVAVDEAPPPLDDRVAELPEVGVDACDDYFIQMRQCVNSNLGPDEREAAAKELRASSRIMLGNVKLKQSDARIENTCKRMRAAAKRRYASKGCTTL